MANKVDLKKYLVDLEHTFDWSKHAHHGYIAEDGRVKDRVVRHDILHLIMCGDKRRVPVQLRYEDEYAIASLQSTMECTGKFTRIPYREQYPGALPGSEQITVEKVREKIFPGALRLLGHTMEHHGRPIPKDMRQNVSDDFIIYYMEIGREFRQQFKEQYGQEYFAMPVQQLAEIPLQDMQKLYAKCADKIAAEGYGHGASPLLERLNAGNRIGSKAHPRAAVQHAGVGPFKS